MTDTGFYNCTSKFHDYSYIKSVSERRSIYDDNYLE